jgi:dihydroorotate dehydrogenase electron transfer subunit
VREVGRDMFVLTLVAPEIAASVEAGQFVMLGVTPGPLLRRPFSVYRVDGERIEVVLKPVGVGTRLLLSARTVSTVGPLGHGFTLDPNGGPVALLSGGVGVAPMPLAAALARRLGLPVTWVHGARTAAELCSEWDGDEVVWATEDGSRGFHGTAVAATPAEASQVRACGPTPMLVAVAARWPHAQVAVETYMGCGTGVCLGCAVPRASGGYDRACTEGPVYRAEDVIWERLPSHLHYEATA